MGIYRPAQIGRLTTEEYNELCKKHEKRSDEKEPLRNVKRDLEALRSLLKKGR